eukprot:3358893-Amphidinium_carterae.2
MLFTPGEDDMPVSENELGDMMITEAQFEDGTVQVIHGFWRLERDPSRRLMTWWSPGGRAKPL